MTLPVPDSQVPPAGGARANGPGPAGACEAASEAPSDPACANLISEDARHPRNQHAPTPPGSRAAGLLGPSEVRGLSRALGIRPTKTLGQNFVHDAGTVRRIVRSSGVLPDDTVLEIGPGLGSLTLALLETGARVIAVEIDPALARALPITVADRMPEAADRLGVVEADALSITGPEALGGVDVPPPTRLVANLPYNVAVPVLLAGGADAAESALRAAGIDPTRRGETLDITAFAALAEALHPIDADEAAAPTPPITPQEQL